MAEAVAARPRVEPLGPHHDRAAFSCGAPALDRYLQKQASQDARRLIAAPFVLVMPDGAIASYYTLSATSVRLADLPAETARRLPRSPSLPAILLGRLAVDSRHGRQGWGRFLLADALHRCVTSEIAAFAVIVDATDGAARGFWERESFLTLPETPNRLFRRLSDIAAAFDRIERER